MNESRLRRIIYALIGVVLAAIIARELFKQYQLEHAALRPTQSTIFVPEQQEPRLYLAAMTDDIDRVRLLLKQGASTAEMGKMGSPLEIAVQRGHRDIVRELLDHHTDPNVYRYTPVLDLAIAHMPEEVPDMLRHGARVTGTSALCSALRARNRSMVMLMLSRGAKLNSNPPAINRSPGRGDIGRQLWIDLPDQHAIPMAYSPLGVAAIFAPTYVDLLVKRGAVLGLERETILIGAAHAGRSDTFARLITLGANPNGDYSHQTPLTEAAVCARDGVPILLQHGARPNVISRSGRTPLIEAILAGDDTCVRTLLAHKADANFHSKSSRSPLWYASRHNHREIVELLKHAGAHDP